jgi:SAM-dependent methyltransferase
VTRSRARSAIATAALAVAAAVASAVSSAPWLGWRLRRRTRFGYYFGIYHWRERGRRVLAGLLSLVVAREIVRESSGLQRWLALPVALWGVGLGSDALSRMLSPPPWHVDVGKYQRLAAHLPLNDAGRVVDVGCGTGRSLVGLAPAVGDATVVGLDVFDDRVILGNGPALARRNAAAAGLDCEIVQGDAASLPLADGSVDVLTACRVVHDLPAGAAESALAEAYRVCEPGGTLGLLELPIPHDADADPVTYWRDLVAAAGFSVREVETFERTGREYIVVVGEA